jgi:hypothetical protein
VTQLPDLSRLSHDDKDALILALWVQVQALTARETELEAKLGAPPKTPGNSSIPPSQGKKPNRDKKTRSGPRPGSLGRVRGGGLSVKCRLDENDYAKGIKVSDTEMATLNLVQADFHGEWNYTIEPRPIGAEAIFSSQTLTEDQRATTTPWEYVMLS